MAATGGISAVGGARARSAVERLADLRWLPALVVAGLVVLAAVLRIGGLDQGLFADELSTWWIISTHGVRGVISSVHSNDEITPPLYFVASELSTKIHLSFAMLRLPSLIAGLATVPLVYLIGRRTVGRLAGVVAAAVVTLAPFMIYYSAEARSYGVLMGLAALSSVAMLLALDTRRTRWWVLYAVASAGVVYTHYTGVFLLAGQLLWLLWAHPEARRPALLSNIGALILFLPWTTGVINDFSSPTTEIFTAISPFTPHGAWVLLRGWMIGFPYSIVPLSSMPGTPALIMLGLSTAIALAAVGVRLARRRAGAGAAAGSAPAGSAAAAGSATAAGSSTAAGPGSEPAGWAPRLGLVAMLALSVPVGEALVSLVGPHVFGGRNLAASSPGLALLFAALLVAAGPRLRLLTVALAIAGLAIGAGKMLGPPYRGADVVRQAVDYVERHAGPRDVIVDETAELSPGPLDALDAELKRPLRVVRVYAPGERAHPFTVFDPNVSAQEAIRLAVAAARGARIYVVEYKPTPSLLDRRRVRMGRAKIAPLVPPKPYRLVASKRYPGFGNALVHVYATPGG